MIHSSRVEDDVIGLNVVSRHLATNRTTPKSSLLLLKAPFVDGHIEIGRIKDSWILVILDLSVGLPSILIVAFIIIEFRPRLVQLGLQSHLILDYLPMSDACVSSLLLFGPLDVSQIRVWALLVLYRSSSF